MAVQRASWFPWVIAGLVSLGVGAVAYNAGMSHGLALNPGILAAPAVAWGWRPGLFFPHGFGFHFFPLFFLVFFGIFVARAFFWRGGWHRNGHGPMSADDFDRWHRDAHDRMNRPPEPTSR